MVNRQRHYGKSRDEVHKKLKKDKEKEIQKRERKKKTKTIAAFHSIQ